MNPSKIPRLDTNMAEKTPVSLLQELSIREFGCSPYYEQMAHESDPKLFSCLVEAFGKAAIGSGRSKKEAKHDASAKIIGVLQMDDQFRDKLTVIPPTPKQSTETDAVGRLLDICVQRNWPIAQFNVMEASGEPHRPEFKVICILSSIKRIGRFSTKKGAKQIAAQAVLDVVQNFTDLERNQQLARVDAEPAEKTFRTYYELKKADIKPVVIRLRHRHRYLQDMPEEDFQEAYKILTKDTISTPRDKVDLVCKALKLEYEIKDIPDHPTNRMFVIVSGNYDCCLIEETGALCNRVVDYFKTMMNIRMM